MLRKKVAAIGLVLAALTLSFPSVASAETDSYAGNPSVRVQDAAIKSCQRSQVMFDAGYFSPGSPVSVGVAGPAADRVSTSGDTAAADGSLIFSFQPVMGQAGVYTVTFTGTAPAAQLARAATVPRTYSAVISVTSDGSCRTPAATASTRTAGADARPALAATGGSVSPWMLGGGALALLAGGTLVGVNASRRRRG